MSRHKWNDSGNKNLEVRSLLDTIKRIPAPTSLHVHCLQIGIFDLERHQRAQTNAGEHISARQAHEKKQKGKKATSHTIGRLSQL